MITKERLFEAITDRFAEHHPKFPWPKKNGLEEQSPEFIRAFTEVYLFVADETRESMERVEKEAQAHFAKGLERLSEMKEKDIAHYQGELKIAKSDVRFYQVMFLLTFVAFLLVTFALVG